MVDSVIIQGAVPGALKEAFGDTPGWATQITLNEVKGILADSRKIQEASMQALLGMAKSILNPDIFAELEAAVKEVTKDLGKQHTGYKQKEKDDKDQHDRLLKSNILYRLLTDKYARYALAITLATDASKLMLATLVKNVSTFDKLYQAGIAVGFSSDGAADAFDSLRRMSGAAGMSVERFGNVVEKSIGANAVGLNKFAQSLPIVSKAMRDFGYNTEQAAAAQGVYLDSLLGFADVQSKSSEEIADGALAFGKSIARLSLVVGMSRQKLLENTTAISQSTDANVLAATMGEQNTLKFSQFIASFKDQNVGQQFLKMMSAKIPGLNKTFQSFAKAGLGGLGMQVMKFTRSLEGASPERAALMTKEFVDGLGNLDAVINQQQLLAEAGVEGAQENLQILTALRQQARAAKDLNWKDIKKNEDAAKALADIQSEWMGITGTLSNIFAPTLGEMQLLGDTLKWVNKALKGFVEMLGLIETRDEKGKITSEANKYVVAVVKWGGLLLAGMAAVAASVYVLVKFLRAKTLVKNALTGMAQGGAGDIASGTASDKKGPGLLSRLGKGIGDLGRGIGRGIYGLSARIGKSIEALLVGLAKGLSALGTPKVLVGVGALAGMAGTLLIAGKALQEFANVSWESIAKGGVTLVGLAGVFKLMSGPIASGLGAFANPKIIIGAGILAGSIVLIGAAVAAATWMVGSALPTFAEGIKSLAGIDGANLIEVAKGIGALSIAMGFFGIGAAGAGVGSAIGAIGDLFSKLFGGGSMIDQLKEFSKIGPGLLIASNAIILLAQGITNLSTALNSFKDTGKLAEIIKATGGVQLAASSGNISVPKNPSPSTISSPSAVPANPANAAGQGTMTKADASPTTGAGLEKPSANSSTNTLIAYQSSVLEEMRDISKRLLSTNENILKRTHP